MKTITQLYIKNGVWLIALGAVLFLVSFFFSADNNVENCSGKVNSNLLEVVATADKQIESFDKNIKYDFQWYQFQNGQLVDWNEHSSGLQRKELIRVKSKKWKLKSYKSGVYLTKIALGKVFLIPCGRRYKVTSSYLYDVLNEAVFPTWVKSIALKKKLTSDKEIQTAFGSFYIQFVEQNIITARTYLYVIGSLFIFVGLLWFRLYSKAKYIVSIVLFVFIIVLFLLLKVFKLPHGLVDTALFSSSHFAYSDIFASLGDIMYLSCVVLLGLWLLFDNLIIKKQQAIIRWIQLKITVKQVSLILSFLGFVIFMLFLKFIYMVNQNTTLLLDITYELNFLSVKFFYYFIFLVICSIFLLSHLLLAKVSLAFESKHFFFHHSVIAFCFLPLGFYYYSTTGAVALCCYFCISGLTFRKAINLDKLLGYELHGVLLLWMLLLSGVVASVIYEQSITRKEIVSSEKAENLVSQEDDETKYFLTQVREEIQDDASIINYMRVPGMGLKRLVKEKIKKAYLHHYFGAFDIDVLLFDHYGKEVFQEKSFNWWQKNYLREEYKRDEGLFFVKNGLGSNEVQYFLEGDFSVRGVVYGRYIVRLSSHHFGTKGIVPELLKTKKIEFGDFEKTHYCVIKDGEVKYTIGKLEYSKDMRQKFLSSHDGFLFDKDGVIHAIKKTSENSGVIVSVEENTFKIWVDNFALHLIILVTIFFGGILSYTLYKVFTGNSIGILSKVQLFLYISFLAPLVLVSVISLSITRVNYEKKIRSDFEQKVKYLTDVVKAVVTKNPSLLEDELQKIADYSQTDMSLFDMGGQLRYTTQPLLYNNYMLSKWINRNAYTEIVGSKQKAIFKSEKINTFDYKSMYVAIQNKETADPLCIVHFPLFYSQTLLTKSKTVQFTTVLEIFVVVFFIIVILSILTYRTIMSPIRLVAKKLNDTSFLENVEPLEWENDDEIGTIVTGYNAMINRISDSKRILEQTQKEKAWRQMAQQVAHEIKNPLTPMKLKLQMMLYKLKGNDEVTQKMSSDITSILGHVDTVSDIATSFSTFAKMPAPVEEIINLQPIIEQEVALFTQKQVSIECEYLESEAEVKTDSKMMGRVISNILLNAIQAYEEADEKRIVIKYRLDNDNVMLCIQDFGKGISDEIAPKVFLPNFTTKATGSGIGLDVAKRGIEFSGGRIWFESVVDEGTTFFIQLPIES